MGERASWPHISPNTYRGDLMETVLTLVAALSLSAIPLVLGWRRTVTEAEIARQLGIAQKKRSFDPVKLALQTGTGLAWNQIVMGGLAWIVGGFVGGVLVGPLVACLFALAGGLLYASRLAE